MPKNTVATVRPSSFYSAVGRVARHPMTRAALKRAGNFAMNRIKKRFKKSHPRQFKTTKPSRRATRRVTNHGDYNPNRFVVVVNKKRPKTTKGVIKHLQTHSSIYSGTAGYQKAQTLFAVGTKDCWLADSGAGYANYQSPQSWFSLNYARAQHANGFIADDYDPDQQKFALLKYNVNLEIWNAETNNAQYTLYWLLSKNEQDNYAENVWDESLEKEDIGYTGSAGPLDGIATAGTNTYGKFKNDDIGCPDPTKGKYFNKFFKVIKKQQLHMSSAAARSIKATIVMNKVVNKDKITKSGNMFQGACGTLSLMVVSRGGLVANYSESGLIEYGVTFGTPKVGLIAHVQATFGILPEQEGSRDQSMGIMDYTSEVPTTRQKLINEIDEPHIVEAV